MLKTAYTRFAGDVGNGFGVSKKSNYTPGRDRYLDLVVDLVPGLIPAPVPMPLPFEHLTTPGFKYETLLIEPPIFLKKLDQDLRDKNVEFKRRTFTNVASVLALAENIVVNCTGLGAKDIWSDNDLHPIKGHLALLKPQPPLTYLFSRNGYLFPRADAVVIGGTYRFGDDTTNAEPDVIQQLVDHMRGVFGVGPETCRCPPSTSTTRPTGGSSPRKERRRAFEAAAWGSLLRKRAAARPRPGTPRSPFFVTPRARFAPPPPGGGRKDAP